MTKAQALSCSLWQHWRYQGCSNRLCGFKALSRSFWQAQSSGGIRDVRIVSVVLKLSPEVHDKFKALSCSLWQHWRYQGCSNSLCGFKALSRSLWQVQSYGGVRDVPIVSVVLKLPPEVYDSSKLVLEICGNTGGIRDVPSLCGVKALSRSL